MEEERRREEIKQKTKRKVLGVKVIEACRRTTGGRALPTLRNEGSKGRK